MEGQNGMELSIIHVSKLLEVKLRHIAMENAVVSKLQ